MKPKEIKKLKRANRIVKILSNKIQELKNELEIKNLEIKTLKELKDFESNELWKYIEFIKRVALGKNKEVLKQKSNPVESPNFKVA